MLVELDKCPRNNLEYLKLSHPYYQSYSTELLTYHGSHMGNNNICVKLAP